MTEAKIILVSGSSGRIGDAVMRRFGSRSEDVVGFDRQAPDPPPPDCTYIPVDVTSDESVEGDDERTPALMTLPEQPKKVILSSIWGMSFPWTLVVSATLGFALTFLPTLFGVSGRAGDVYHVGGPLILTMAILAMGEPLRLIRYLNMVLGMGVAVAPWMVDGSNGLGSLVGAVLGLAAAALALPRGPIRERYGLGHRFVR